MDDHQEFCTKWAPAFPSLLTLSLSLCAQMVYFSRFTWVITVMEEHLRQQQGFSWGEEQKGNLWVHVRAQKDSWLMKQGEYLKQQILFVNWQMCSVILQKWHVFMWKFCIKLRFKLNEISFLHHQCGHQKSKCRSLSLDERIYCSTAICVSGLLYICKTLLCHQKTVMETT